MKKARERLIDSASLLFADKGYHAVGTREISAHADANISLVSFYFGSKNGLLKAVLDTLVASGMNQFEAHLTEPSSKIEFKSNLKKFLETLSLFYIEHSDSLRVYMQELETGNSDALEHNCDTFGSVWNKLVAYIETAQKKKIITAGNSSALAFCILSPINALMQNRNCVESVIRISLDDKKFRDQLIEQIVSNVS